MEFISDVLVVALNASKRELEAPGNLLSDGKHSDTMSRCARFANEPLVAMYISKEVVMTEEMVGEGVGELSDLG